MQLRRRAISEPATATQPRPVLRAVVTLLFVALLAGLVVLRRVGASTDDVRASSRSAALARYGFVLQDVAGKAGIRFTHAAPVLDARLTPIMPLVAALGAAVSVVDYDRDGWSDLYVTSSGVGSHNALYRNRGDGTFEDVAPRLGLADVNRAGTGVSMGAVWGDFDNDGYEDLFLYKWGRVELFHNDRGHGFTRVTDAAGFPPWMNANTAVWLDFDGDGLLDLFVGCFYPADLDLWHLKDTHIMPESFEYANNGGRNYLFHNLGNGRFEEVGQKLGLTSTRWTLAATAADVNGDGYPDLLVANDFGISELYINERGRGFREVGRAAGIGRSPKSGMNASAADVLDRGAWDFFVSNIAEPGVLLHGNDLWVPDGGSAGAPRFRDLAGAMGVEVAGWSYGAQFGDLDNDGWLDVFVANGHVSGRSRDSYWYDYSKVASGNRAIIADTRNWPALQGRSLSGYQRDRVWRNDGAGRFQEAGEAVGVDDRSDGRAVAMADLWNRGVLDVVVASQGGRLRVYRTDVTGRNHWLELELHGTHSNASAIGAVAHLYWSGKEQLQQVDGGSGFASQNDRRLHFGLGTAVSVDSVVLRWPSKRRQVLTSPAIDRLHVVTEPR